MKANPCFFVRLVCLRCSLVLTLLFCAAQIIHTVFAYTRFCLWWLCLGIASSVGLGELDFHAIPCDPVESLTVKHLASESMQNIQNESVCCCVEKTVPRCQECVMCPSLAMCLTLVGMQHPV